MAMNKAARMAMEMLRKSMPSKPMNRKDAERVEKAIRENPKLYRKLSPHQVLDMLDMPKITGKRIVNKKVGGLMKAVKAIKDKINKKDSKGNTISIFGKPSPKQQQTKKGTKAQRTTRREKAKSLGKGIIVGGGTVGAIEGLKGKKSQSPAKLPAPKKPKATKKPIPKIASKPLPRPKKKSSGVTFGFEVIPKGGKTKKFSGGGKVGGMKSGSATPNRLY